MAIASNGIPLTSARITLDTQTVTAAKRQIDALSKSSPLDLIGIVGGATRNVKVNDEKMSEFYIDYIPTSTFHITV